MVIMAITFSLMATVIVKLLDEVSFIEKLFFCYMTVLIVTVINIKRKKISVKTNVKKKHFVRAVLGIMSLGTFYYVAPHMELTDITALDYVYPLFILLNTFELHKEKIKKNYLGILFMSLVGAVLIINPKLNSEMIYIGISLVAIYIQSFIPIYLNELKKTEKTEVILFYYSLTSVLVFGPMFILNFKPMSLKTIIGLIMIGICTSLFQYLNTTSYKYLEMNVISIYKNLRIVIATIFAVVVFKQEIVLQEMVGIMLIVAGVLLSFKFNHHVSEDKEKLKANTSNALR
jgi:drug/metabolite transporter (DMT)-like permease